MGLSMSVYGAETVNPLWPEGTKNASVFRSYKRFDLPGASDKDYEFNFTIEFGKVLIKPSEDNTVGIKVKADSQAIQKIRFNFHQKGFTFEACANQVLLPVQDTLLNSCLAIGRLTQGSRGTIKVSSDSPQIRGQPLIGSITQGARGTIRVFSDSTNQPLIGSVTLGDDSSFTYTSFTSNPKKLEQKTVIYLPKSLPKSKISIQASDSSQCSLDSILAQKMEFIFNDKARLVTTDPIKANCIKIKAKDHAKIDLASEVIKMRISAQDLTKISNKTEGLLGELKTNLQDRASVKLEATVQNAKGKILDNSEIYIGTITKDHQLMKYHQAQIHIDNILNLE